MKKIKLFHTSWGFSDGTSFFPSILTVHVLALFPIVLKALVAHANASLIFLLLI